MTNERASASDDARPIEPVTDWENDDSKGLALCAESLFREHVELAQARRDRQAAYLDSLPTDPTEVIRAALKLMHPRGETYLEGFEEALHLSVALEALIKDGDVDEEISISRESALHIADRIVTSLRQAARQIDRISDILGNPPRIERESKFPEPR